MMLHPIPQKPMYLDGPGVLPCLIIPVPDYAGRSVQVTFSAITGAQHLTVSLAEAEAEPLRRWCSARFDRHVDGIRTACPTPTPTLDRGAAMVEIAEAFCPADPRGVLMTLTAALAQASLAAGIEPDQAGDLLQDTMQTLIGDASDDDPTPDDPADITGAPV